MRGQRGTFRSSTKGDSETTRRHHADRRRDGGSDPAARRARAKAAVPLIGLLSGTHFNPTEVEGIKAGLGDAGFKEGDNIRIEYRSAEGQYDLLPALAADLVHREVAVIVTIGGAASAPPAKAATSTIPIVFANGADPVKLGLVASLNRPGGNVTGASFLVNSLSAKRVEMLHSLIQSAASVGFLVNPENPSHNSEAREIATAAKALGEDVRVEPATGEADIDAAFAHFSQQHVGAISVAADAYFLGRREQIVDLAAKYALPGIYPREEYVAAGGLMSYAPRRRTLIGLPAFMPVAFLRAKSLRTCRCSNPSKSILRST